MEIQKTQTTIGTLTKNTLNESQKRVYEYVPDISIESFLNIFEYAFSRSEKSEQTSMNLTKSMITVAKLYGARVKPVDPVLIEAKKTFYEDFSALVPMEIFIAYKMFAKGELKTENAEMYGGEFNLLQFIRILKAYQTKKIIIERRLDFEKKSNKIDAEIQKRKNARKQFDFDETIKELKIKNKDWNETPVFLFDLARKKELIVLNEDIISKYKSIALKRFEIDCEDLVSKGRKYEANAMKMNKDQKISFFCKKISVHDQVLNLPI